MKLKVIVLAKASKIIGRRRGRSALKREAILDAGRTLFFRDGFNGVAIEAVAAAAGVSKVTVYGHFATKEVLLVAVIDRELNEQSVEFPIDLPISLMGLRAALLTVGARLAAFLDRSDIVDCGRLMISQRQKMPELVQKFFDTGPSLVVVSLSALLARAQALSLFPRDADTGEAAITLVSLLLGLHQIERLLGISGPLEGNAFEAHVSQAVDRFLTAYVGK